MRYILIFPLALAIRIWKFYITNRNNYEEPYYHLELFKELSHKEN